MSDKFLKLRTQFIPITLGLVYCWFGALKFIPGMSPAEELAKTTLNHIFFNTVSSEVSILMLAIIECSFGIMLIFYEDLKYTLIAAMIHLSCTFIPLLMFPELTFGLAGQYILKNIIILAALIAIYPFKRKESDLHSFHPDQIDSYKNL